MNKNKTKKFIMYPSWWFLLLLYIVTILAVVGTILVTKRIEEKMIWYAYILYIFAAIGLGYSIYTVVRGIPTWKIRFISFMKKHRFTNQILEHYGFRTIVFAIFSFGLSIAYVILNGVIGIKELSIWYGSLASYYLLLAIMRGSVLLYYQKRKKEDDLFEKERRGIQIYRRCGLGLIILPLALSFAIAQMIRGTNSFEHAGLMIYISAIYAFYKITMAIINIFRAHRSDEYPVRAIRSVNLADAFVSILALQTAMFKEFGADMNSSLMNLITGTIVCLLTLLLGIYMVVVSYKNEKLLCEDEQKYEE